MNDRPLPSRCIGIEAAGSLYGLPVDQVREVMGRPPITRVFHAPEALAGVTNLRGEVLPVLDLALLLGASEPTDGNDARIVVVLDPGGLRAGLLVERLAGLRELGSARLAPVPSTLPEAQARAARGVLEEPPPCLVLDVGLLLSSPVLASMSGRA